MRDQGCVEGLKDLRCEGGAGDGSDGSGGIVCQGEFVVVGKEARMG